MAKQNLLLGEPTKGASSFICSPSFGLTSLCGCRFLRAPLSSLTSSASSFFSCPMWCSSQAADGDEQVNSAHDTVGKVKRGRGQEELNLTVTMMWA
ncbi:hypothetical protein GN956_G20009 [Arapaima gigas]